MNTAALAPIIGAKPGTHLEIVPGKKYVPVPACDVEPLALAELVPAGDGTFRVVARVCPRHFSCSEKNLRRLGIDISKRTMQRLINGGFVRGQKTTPNLFQFDFFSYLEHEAAVAADPEFWEKTEPGQRFTNLERFRQAL